MSKKKHSSTCTICGTNLKVLQGKKCDMCNSQVCNNCCYREKGVRALFRLMNNFPVVMCNKCLYVQQTSKETENSTEIVHDNSEEYIQQWIEEFKSTIVIILLW